VLLTGATGGLGNAIARALGGRGAKLILSGRRTDVLEPLAEEVGARAIAADLTDRAAVDRLATEAGDVDILVANAGIPADGAVLEYTADQIDRALDVNLRAPLILALARVAETHKLARITRHGELVAQHAAPMVRIGRATVVLPPGAFLQATAFGEETLARLVLALVGSAKAVADLFAGVGPFALRLAERARVLAADSDAGAIDALRRAAAATSGLKPIMAEVRDLFRRPFVAQELAGLDAVVFDPPRQGAEAQARELAKSRVPVVVAVSCNPVTFARDAKILVEGGYRLGEVTPVDQFRYSAHVEIVARLAR